MKGAPIRLNSQRAMPVKPLLAFRVNKKAQFALKTSRKCHTRSSIVNCQSPEAKPHGWQTTPLARIDICQTKVWKVAAISPGRPAQEDSKALDSCTSVALFVYGFSACGFLHLGALTISLSPLSRCAHLRIIGSRIPVCHLQWPAGALN